MKELILIIVCGLGAPIARCQDRDLNFKDSIANYIQSIQIIFEDYVQYQESTDSQEDQDLMEQNLLALTKVTDQNQIIVLLNVWMYYDPTDFACRDLVYRILINSRSESVDAIKNRITHKKDWETSEMAPYSELSYLLEQLEEL